MEEYNNQPSSESTKDEKPSKKKTRDAVSLGGLAANESLIWERDTVDKPISPKEKEAPLLAPPIPTLEEVSEKVPVFEHEIEQVEEAEENRLAELTPDESRAITEQYANARGQEVTAEQAIVTENSPEAIALIADAAMIESLQQKLQADETLNPDLAVEQAYNETLRTIEASGITPDAELSPQTEAATSIHNANLPPPPQPPSGNAANSSPPPSFPGRFTYPGATPFGGSEQSAPTTVPDKNTISINEAAYYERRAETRGLLVGGIIGYLVGRRRGRIKTEKRLLPVQRKLETQVIRLHDTIAIREQELRTVVAQKARLASVTERQALTARLRPEVSVRPKQSEVVEQAVARPSTEATQSRQPEAIKTAEAIQAMTHQEILAVSEKVRIEGTTLKDIYEAKQITEPGLRRIVSAYLQGGEVKRVLDQELLIKEMTFERDPQIRDRLATNPSSSSPSAVQSQPYEAQPAALPTGGRTAEAATVSPIATQRKKSAPSTEQIIVRAWVTVIVVLSIIALILLLR